MTMRASIFVQAFIFLNVIYEGVCQSLIINTTIGQVRGVLASDGDYNMYMGIPYAQVDENNPFGVAIPQPKFDGIFEANDDSAICPQEEEFNNTIVGSLDCLHLSIFVPSSANSTNLLPVFLYIYGGGFNIGFYGRFVYGPKYLVRHDIVVVTLNYRLGPYGFMSLDTPEVPGNQGLKDQVMAMRWIQENIAAFGGDPSKITAAGNSAGGMSVDHHLLSTYAGPQLFQRSIFQSGTTLAIGPSESNRDAPFIMAQHLGYETDDVTDAIKFLAKVDPHVIIATVLELNISFEPIVEKEFEGVEAFTTEDWTTVTEVPAVKNMDIIIGFNNDELLDAATNDELFNPFIVTIVLSLFFDPTHEDYSVVVDIVQNFYFGDEVIDNNQIQPLIDLLSDLVFIYPIHRSIKRFLDNDAGNLYLYMFSYAGQRNFIKDMNNIDFGGATHADEIGYLFDVSYMGEPSIDDQTVLDAMTTMWANFVKNGNPTPQTSQLLPHKWEAITNNSYHYINIDRELSVGTRPLQERMTFWDLFYDGFEHLRRTTNFNNSDILRQLWKLLRY